MVPVAVSPVNDMVVLEPLQTVAKVAVAVPPTLTPFTVTNAELLDAGAQTPLVTTAL